MKESRSKEYRCWVRMLDRCFDPDHKDYDDYGGRGITVSDRWKESYPNFLKDMGRAPTPEHTIDRLNNEKGYSKKNCVWATRKEQAQNRRTSKHIEFRGMRLTMAQWADFLGCSRKRLWKRLSMGWPLDKVLSPWPADGGWKLRPDGGIQAAA